MLPKPGGRRFVNTDRNKCKTFSIRKFRLAMTIVIATELRVYWFPCELVTILTASKKKKVDSSLSASMLRLLVYAEIQRGSFNTEMSRDPRNHSRYSD
jgi:hypothetical protein